MTFDDKNFQTEIAQNEIALRVTSSLDISNALTSLRTYLAMVMPIDELILFHLNEKTDTFEVILRVSETQVIGKDNATSFFVKKEDGQLARQKLLEQEEPVSIYTRAALTQKMVHMDLDVLLTQSSLPVESDFLMLFDSTFQGGLFALSYHKDAYNEQNEQQLATFAAPFQIAMNNAVQFNEVQHKRDALADENALFREATVRLTSEPEIGKAFQSIAVFLQKNIALNQIVLLGVDDSIAKQRVLLRVDGLQRIESQNEYLQFRRSGEGIQERQRIFEDLPNVFVKDSAERNISNAFGDLEHPEQLTKLGISPTDNVVILGVKAIRMAILFVFDKREDIKTAKKIIDILREPFVISLHNAMRFYDLEEHKNRLVEENHELLTEMQRDVGDRVIGMHDGLKHVMSLATQVAPKPSPVLLMGETGTGKEVVATAIHRFSDRSNGPFISLNCGAIPETLVDSELFGHEKGAFTGANARKRGRFERAGGGTLFLDEVGELPASAQVKLLRVLQEKEFERVGGSHSIAADVRLIAATNRDLPHMVRKGHFREDLWFRLNVFPIEIPPLRLRTQDIPALTYFFIETKIRQLNLPFRPSLPAEEMQKLTQYKWPGNVRELQNTIERALILCKGEPLRFPYVGAEVVSYESVSPMAVAESTPASVSPALGSPPMSHSESERIYFTNLLTHTRGKIAGPGGAAEISKLNPSTLRSKLKKLGITSIKDL